MTFPYDLSVPQFNDMRSQMPHAICELSPGIVNAHLLVNRDKTPFSDTGLRRAMALSIDRKAVVDTLGQGQGQIGGVLQPPPGGLWGMPADQVAKLPGYDPDVPRRREEARQIMQKLGYGPDHRLPINVTTRDWSIYRDPAVLMIDQLKQVYIDGELEIVDTAQYFPKIQRTDFTVALNFQTAGPDPDPIVHLFYGCGSGLNWDGYCSAEVDKMIEQQSREATPTAASSCCGRSSASWLRTTPGRSSITARAGPALPYVKGLTIDVNYIFGSWRMEDVWLDK